MTLNKQEAETSRIAELQDEKQKAVEALQQRQRKMKEQASREELKKYMLVSRQARMLKEFDLKVEKQKDNENIQRHQKFLAQASRREM